MDSPRGVLRLVWESGCDAGQFTLCLRRLERDGSSASRIDIHL